jgi:hypothetical protein
METFSNAPHPVPMLLLEGIPAALLASADFQARQPCHNVRKVRTTPRKPEQRKNKSRYFTISSDTEEEACETRDSMRDNGYYCAHLGML